MAKRMIVDCDAGMDDASALFLATKAHKVGVVELVAITTTHGNTTLYIRLKAIFILFRSYANILELFSFITVIML
jgi:inosine-uridine nucleoside N-ribohydrolase